MFCANVVRSKTRYIIIDTLPNRNKLAGSRNCKKSMMQCVDLQCFKYKTILWAVFQLYPDSAVDLEDEVIFHEFFAAYLHQKVAWLIQNAIYGICEIRLCHWNIVSTCSLHTAATSYINKSSLSILFQATTFRLEKANISRSDFSISWLLHTTEKRGQYSELTRALAWRICLACIWCCL